MKQFVKSTVIAVAAMLAACSTDNTVADDSPKINIKIHAGFPQTRTTFGDKNDQTDRYPVFWEYNDSFAIVEHIDGAQSQVITAHVDKLSDDRKSAEIFAELSMKRGNNFDYYAYYPYEAYKDGAMIIPASQTPSATSADPLAMLLYASKEGLAAQTPEIDLSFNHLAAYARMTVYGLSGENDNIVSVTFSTAEDLAGTLDIESGALANGSHSVTADVSSLGYTTADKFDIWFTVAPQENIKTFSVNISTKKRNFTKDFAISSGKPLAFKRGVVSNFTINMSDAMSGDITIYVETPGTLEQIIEDLGIDITMLEGVAITGHLNSADYEYIKTWSNLKVLDISGLDDTTIPEGCFRESEIETVILPVNLTSIPDYAFYGSKITSINIPDTVRRIGDYAFYNCTKVKGDLVIPDATDNLGAYCFYGCTFDGSLTLGKGLDTIGAYCFCGCSQLSGDLVLPDKLRLIYRYAFYGCSGFANHNLVIGENIVTIYSYAFIENYYNPIKFSKVYIKKRYNTSIFIPDQLEDMISFVYPFGLSAGGYWNGAYYLLDYLGVPIGCKNLYKDRGYTVFRTIEEVEF